MSPPDPALARWVETWKSTGPALEEIRRAELRRMTEAEALAAAEDLLSIPVTVPLPEARRASSGLVVQQALFHRRPRA